MSKPQHHMVEGYRYAFQVPGALCRADKQATNPCEQAAFSLGWEL